MPQQSACYYWRALRGTPPEIKGNARLLVFALAGHADADGRCYPSIKRLAAEVSTGERNIAILLGQLKARGLLVIEAAGGGRHRANHYRLLLPAVSPNSESDAISETENPDPPITDHADETPIPRSLITDAETLITATETLINPAETLIPGSDEQPVEQPKEQPNVVVRPLRAWWNPWIRWVKTTPTRGDMADFDKRSRLIGRCPTEEEWEGWFAEAYTKPGVRKPLGWVWHLATTTQVAAVTQPEQTRGDLLAADAVTRTEAAFHGNHAQPKYERERVPDPGRQGMRMRYAG